MYSSASNRVFVCPFSDFNDGWLYVIDCASDRIVEQVPVGNGGDGYLNTHNDLLYFATASPYRLFVIDSGGAVIKVRDSVANPLAFRNKGDIHRIYVGARYDSCLLVLSPGADTVIDTVPEVDVSHGGFSYYDSTDDRLYYPVWTPSRPDTFGILVIDCATNRVVDTIYCRTYTDGRDAVFQEIGFWNPVSNRLYYGDVVDCGTNRVIARVPALVPTRMAWNAADNVVFVNDHWCAKVVAVIDDLIGTEEGHVSARGLTTAGLLCPSTGTRFAVQAGLSRDLGIADVAGRVVARVRHGQPLFDARSLAPGVYFATVRACGRTDQVQKFTVVR